MRTPSTQPKRPPKSLVDEGQRALHRLGDEVAEDAAGDEDGEEDEQEAEEIG